MLFFASLGQNTGTRNILNEIISEKKIETPIIDQINNVLFFGKDPKLAIKDLLNRKDVKE